MKVTILSPHCDDHILACSGTIINLVEKDHDVTIVFMTNGYSHPPKKLEWVDAIAGSCKDLGVKHHMLGLSNQRFDEYTLIDINQKIEALELEPDLVISPTPHDANYDHTVTYRSALTLARPIGRPVSHISMEAPSSTEWGGVAFDPKFYVPLTIKQVLARNQLMEKHFAPELRAPPHPRSLQSLGNLAERRGVMCGCLYAEAFEVNRLYSIHCF